MTKKKTAIRTIKPSDIDKLVKPEKIDTQPVAVCETCKYAAPISGFPDAVHCHRYPLSNRANATHWCGEWKAK